MTTQSTQEETAQRQRDDERPENYWLLASIIVVATVVLFHVAGEIALRFMPVATGMWSQPVDASQPIFRFFPNRDFLFSRDWNFSLTNRGHINNDGFVNDENYAVDDPRPLLAVVGDSQVEAAMVPNGKTFYRCLDQQLGQKGRVYSFAASGAPLSQYLIWAQYAVQKYRAGGVVIVVVGNDFDESLWAYSQAPGFNVYARGADGRLFLRRNDYHPSPLRELVRHSALGRYLVFHLHARDAAKAMAQWRFSTGADQAPENVGNTAASASPERVRDSYEAITAFFDDLPKMVLLPPDRIAFLVDGARYQRDVAVTDQSYWGLMRKRLMSEAAQRGHEVIDMQPRFVERSRDGHTVYEHPTDAHWNPVAHGVAADALASSRLYRSMFGR